MCVWWVEVGSFTEVVPTLQSFLPSTLGPLGTWMAGVHGDISGKNVGVTKILRNHLSV